MLALEDALLSAYKKTPGAAKYARVDMARESGDFSVYELLIPADLEERLLSEVETEEPTVDPETGEMREPRGARARPRDARPVPRSDRGARRHARGLRPHRRADRQAGDPAADPRGRARHDVRGVPGPRRRADHRASSSSPTPATRSCSCASASRRCCPKSEQVDNERYDHGQRDQGDHHRRLRPGQGPEHHRLAPLPGADPEAVRARGAGDRRRPRRDPERGPRARLPLEDRGGLARRRRGSGRRLRGAARIARAHGRVRAARREDRHHPLQRGARPLRGQGPLARARARGARRRREQAGHGRSSPTTSCRSRSARRARTPASPRG